MRFYTLMSAVTALSNPFEKDSKKSWKFVNVTEKFSNFFPFFGVKGRPFRCEGFVKKCKWYARCAPFSTISWNLFQTFGRWPTRCLQVRRRLFVLANASVYLSNSLLFLQPRQVNNLSVVPNVLCFLKSMHIYFYKAYKSAHP